MRYFVLMSFCAVSLSCSSTSPFISYSGDISVDGLDAAITSSSAFFSIESVQKTDSISMIDERANHYLNIILDGYYQQTGNVKFSNIDKSDMAFSIREVNVNTGYFTMNFIDPGPILRIKMVVDIYYFGDLIETETYRTRVNMAQVINSDRFWNWLTNKQKNNVDNQIEAFEIGLRTLYRNLFFKHLDISLKI